MPYNVTVQQTHIVNDPSITNSDAAVDFVRAGNTKPARTSYTASEVQTRTVTTPQQAVFTQPNGTPGNPTVSVPGSTAPSA